MRSRWPWRLLLRPATTQRRCQLGPPQARGFRPTDRSCRDARGALATPSVKNDEGAQDAATSRFRPPAPAQSLRDLLLGLLGLLGASLLAELLDLRFRQVLVLGAHHPEHRRRAVGAARHRAELNGTLAPLAARDALHSRAWG